MSNSDGLVRFQTTLVQASGMRATGIIIPPEIVERLGGGRRAPVRVEVNGYEYRSTLAVMGGHTMVGVSAAIRAETGLSGGDTVDVEVVVDRSARLVDVPRDLADALTAVAGTREFFDALSNSLRRYHVDSINGAKTPETRQRRINKAVSLFGQGKNR